MSPIKLCNVILGFCLILGNVQAQTPDLQKMSLAERTAYMSKMREASQADWQSTIDKLNLKLPTLPPPASDPKRPKNIKQKDGSNNWYDEAGNMYVRSNWGNWTNYDEAKANDYKLPDPLVLKNGKPVKNASTWWKQRRPEILNDYLTEIFGKIPENTPAVTFAATGTDSTVLSGKAIRKAIVGRIDNAHYPSVTPSIPMMYYRPVKVSKKIPLMVIVWGSFPQPMPSIEKLIDAGWAVALVNTSSIQMDSGAGLREGIIGLVNGGNVRKSDDWGVLAAWSWGLSRVLDYFEKDKGINTEQIGIEGHSRWGKTALLAGALDPRWAIVFASCSGSMGASLEKRSFGETIDNVASSSEYHWMAGNFLKYAGHWDAMPVDAHDMMALIAPRPLFITGGTKDLWADPKGEFLACVGVSPVYKLLGKKGLKTAEMPAPDVALIESDIAFRNHEGGHVDILDWPVFLKFAQRQFKLKK